jgi:hypothetical protein
VLGQFGSDGVIDENQFRDLRRMVDKPTDMIQKVSTAPHRTQQGRAAAGTYGSLCTHCGFSCRQTAAGTRVVK